MNFCSTWKLKVFKATKVVQSTPSSTKKVTLLKQIKLHLISRFCLRFQFSQNHNSSYPKRRSCTGYVCRKLIHLFLLCVCFKLHPSIFLAVLQIAFYVKTSETFSAFLSFLSTHSHTNRLQMNFFFLQLFLQAF